MLLPVVILCTRSSVAFIMQHPQTYLCMDAPITMRVSHASRSPHLIRVPHSLLAKNSDEEENDSRQNNNQNQNGNEKIENKIDAFLDKQIFDPESESNQDNWFANLVKNDYDSAEALYVGVFVFAGVVISQELLRIVKYGESYIPFGQGGGGNLF